MQGKLILKLFAFGFCRDVPWCALPGQFNVCRGPDQQRLLRDVQPRVPWGHVTRPLSLRQRRHRLRQRLPFKESHVFTGKIHRSGLWGKMHQWVGEWENSVEFVDPSWAWSLEGRWSSGSLLCADFQSGGGVGGGLEWLIFQLAVYVHVQPCQHSKQILTFHTLMTIVFAIIICKAKSWVSNCFLMLATLSCLLLQTKCCLPSNPFYATSTSQVLLTYPPLPQTLGLSYSY